MWKRIKEWLTERFLPMWAKESVFAENRQLKEKVKMLEQRLEVKNAYTEGLVAGMKYQRRIIINTSEGQK